MIVYKGHASLAAAAASVDSNGYMPLGEFTQEDFDVLKQFELGDASEATGGSYLGPTLT